MKHRYALQLALFSLLIGALAACSIHKVKSTNHVPVERVSQEIPEHLLLDVGIQIFDPGIDDAADSDDLVFPEVRRAESRYMPVMLAETLQSSAAWGAVRVVPAANKNSDVTVRAKIVQSDGEQLELALEVLDISGREWFARTYHETASHYAYNKRLVKDVDPFQGIYNQIANDMLAFQRTLTDTETRNLRTIAELRFARDFSPQAFSDHLQETKDGRFAVMRLPAADDPMLNRVRRIRERDYLFVDTLQDYYGTFVREMDGPYQTWRAESYDAVITQRELESQATTRTIAGIAAIVGGIAAAGNNSGSGRVAGQVAVAAGGYMVKSGFDKREEAKMHSDMLIELGDSLEAAIEPQVIELEDRTITLSGTVENQYDQWRELLKEIYKAETGL
ncbi:hypothetical protein L1F30_10775 [Simiduia sp. 21SJ11W-1]|uniref:hypothetical protein n=1 Tax=Simiduia sp. 21SJ11W-1 TaxID=2909669 RepID=UPI00209D616A|nr:hypothetical protein [Simiduia sp. 21SJ11W-1]UTA46646.1 hypothetical protein L1F30_10775 [Simiduia sp. 21SJ11W-1]